MEKLDSSKLSKSNQENINSINRSITNENKTVRRLLNEQQARPRWSRNRIQPDFQSSTVNTSTVTTILIQKQDQEGQKFSVILCLQKMAGLTSPK